ncbi:NADH-quinone oxidoreductase subunit J [Actinomyces denticolens]|uniref:NADH-quinone oxidoreductase subunit J n=1 Tax=Actinomyces denticolens TaxID=52767 RepID=A0ABY1I042_9ACTO|nr:NADH-quinone oxidoreductase subunit J [Actinomyces denticolens]SHI28633.1 NADH-quinone oxidoreductase subunit J [Actinomyces denticolens]
MSSPVILLPLAPAPAALSGSGTVTLGETILFGVVALVTIACGIGLLTAKRAVAAAVNMIVIMIGLAILYIANEAPFLGVTQVVVYTGAIMTLVLFVIMLVGVGGEEPVGATTSRAQVPLIALIGAALAGALGLAVWQTSLPRPAGLDSGSAADPAELATALFERHVVTMELTAMLLIVAALGALTLTHRQRIRPKRSQARIAQDKLRDYAIKGAHPGQRPMPGVYAATNSAAAPALDADGAAVEDSVPRVLRARDLGYELAEVSPETAAAARAGRIRARTEARVAQSGMASMPGAAAPSVIQPVAAPALPEAPAQDPALPEAKEEDK